MNESEKLGRLERVDVRDIWESESSDFTPWLARTENLELLGETLDLQLELEAQEKDVGPFRADILCKDTGSDRWVLVENQLERTDHRHLGQLITYAAGLRAVTIVWIATPFTDEHRAALDWLNDITGSEVNFFGLEVEVWRIGDSLSAPKFDIVVEPNDWKKSIGTDGDNLTETKKTQLRFWTAFSEYVYSNDARVRPRKPGPHHWMNMAIGRAGFNLAAIASFWDSKAETYDSHEVRAEFVVREEAAGSYFAKLEADKEKIEGQLGYPVTWQRSESSARCKLYVRKPVANLADERSWPDLHQWLLRHLEDFHRVLGPRVREL